jgi:hypothetical protein
VLTAAFGLGLIAEAGTSCSHSSAFVSAANMGGGNGQKAATARARKQAQMEASKGKGVSDCSVRGPHACMGPS